MAKVFISYRRADSAPSAGRIYDRLAAKFGRKNVFKDVDDIPPGVNFMTYIQDTLRQCAVALVVIGPQWLDGRNAEGERRLDDPADFLRIEIETAFAIGLAVIPILLDGATMPSPARLPESLRPLSLINGLAVRNDPDFARDMERVIASLERAFGSRPSSGRFGRRSAPESAPAPAATAAPHTAPEPDPVQVAVKEQPRTQPRPPSSGFDRAWRPLAAGLAALLIVASFAVLLSGHGASLLAIITGSATSTTAARTATPTGGRLTFPFPYSAPAPGPGLDCDKGAANWDEQIDSHVMCLTTPTPHTRLSINPTGQSASIYLSTGGGAGKLPQTYTLSVEVSNISQFTIATVDTTTSPSGDFSSSSNSRCSNDRYYYTLDSSGNYNLRHFHCNPDQDPCNNAFTSSVVGLASGVTLAIVVSSTQVEGRVNGTSIGSCNDTTMSTTSTQGFARASLGVSGVSSAEADFANFKIE